MPIAALASSLSRSTSDSCADLAPGRQGPEHRHVSATSTEEVVRHVTFLLTPGFCFYAVTAVIEAFALANRLAGRQAYCWRLVSADQRLVQSAAGIALECNNLLELERLGLSAGTRTDLVIVASDLPAGSSLLPAVGRFIQEQAQAGTVLLGIGRGAFLLADTGLLDGRRCAIHWQYLAEMKARYPKVDADCHLNEISDDLMTSAGQTASLDIILSVIRRDLGMEIASALCDQHVVEQVRPARQRQRQPEVTSLEISNPRLATVVSLMKANPAPPLPLSALARKVGMSRRQIERLFELEGQDAPTRFYLRVRLERAQQMLRKTPLPVVDIGKACGFVSASHFSKCYRKCFGHSPRQEREGEFD